MKQRFEIGILRCAIKMLLAMVVLCFTQSVVSKDAVAESLANTPISGMEFTCIGENVVLVNMHLSAEDYNQYLVEVLEIVPTEYRRPGSADASMIMDQTTQIKHNIDNGISALFGFDAEVSTIPQDDIASVKLALFEANTAYFGYSSVRVSLTSVRDNSEIWVTYFDSSGHEMGTSAFVDLSDEASVLIFSKAAEYMEKLENKQ